MDGNVIKRVGIQTYLDNEGSQQYSNIDIFANKKQLIKNWSICNFGCHTPSYRVVQQPASYAQFIKVIESVDPTRGFATGVVDGSIKTFSKVGNGVQRVGESYGLAGSERLSQIADENSAVYHNAKKVITSLLSMDISLIDNPLTQICIKIVDTYMALVPTEITCAIAEEGKLEIDKVDSGLIEQAIKKGLCSISIEDIVDLPSSDQVLRVMKDNSSFVLKQAGKWQGNKLATYLSTIIAVTIAKQIAIMIARSPAYKNMLKIRDTKTAKGLAGVAIFLLKNLGMLQIASEASQRLQHKCPSLWWKLNRASNMDLIYFLVEPYVSEYVDRIGVAEKSPQKFVEMVAALITADGSASDILLPGQVKFFLK